MRIKLGVPLRACDIANACNAQYRSAEGEAVISYITTDSRELKAGDLFIALRGERHSGEDYAIEAVRRGAFALSSKPTDKGFFHHSPEEALLKLASFYNKKLPYILYRIGITGSVGKTTTREFVRRILSARYKTHTNEGNFNNLIGMPLSLLQAPKNTEIIALEIGMNGINEIRKMSECLCPDTGIITNIGTSHIGSLGSLSGIARAKSEILYGMNGHGKVVIPYGEPLLNNIPNNVSFSITDCNADVFIKRVSGESVSVFYLGEPFCFGRFNIIGDHHLKCLGAAVATAIISGMNAEEISEGISLVSYDNIRQKVYSIGNYIIHEDCYNASLESMEAVISSFTGGDENAVRSIVLGDVLELGQYSKEIHTRIGKVIPKDRVTNLFLFGPQAYYIGLSAEEAGFPQNRIFQNPDLSDPAMTAAQIIKTCRSGEHILFKASRGVMLERVIKHLKQSEGIL